MKILQIIPSLASGGAERIVVDLCNELNQQGEDVFLCTIQDPTKADYGFFLKELNTGVRFISLKKQKGFRFGNIYRLKKIIDTIKPDVIHIHLSILLYSYFLAFLYRGKFVHTIHSLVEKTISSKKYLYLNRFCYKYKFIQAITISEACNASYQKNYKLTNAAVIYNGRKNNAGSEMLESVRNDLLKLKDSSDDTIFIHVARFHEAKNQSVLVQVFNRLAQEGFKYQLVILGDWSFCEEAEDLARKVCNNIHFLGTQNNVQDYLLCSDAFCLTSIYEGLPISLLEALACGSVPICTPVGGIKDVIQDGITGYLSSDVTEQSYYKTIVRYLQNKSAIQRVTLIEYFNNHFSIEKTVLQHRELYKRLQSKK